MRRVFCFFVLFLFLVFSACEEGDQSAPARIKDLTFFTDPKALARNEEGLYLKPERFPATTYALAWTATGDNGEEGKSALYDLRWLSEFELRKYGAQAKECSRDNNFLHQASDEPFPRASGKTEILSLIDFPFHRGVKYYFCLWAIDEVGQASEPAFLEAEIPFLGIGLTTRKTRVLGLGEKIAVLGRFNKDKFTDVSVSSPSQGKVMIYLGKDSERLFYMATIFGKPLKKVKKLGPWLQISGEQAEAFGFAMSGLGDLDKNHKPDLAVSAPNSASGKIYLFAYSSAHSLSSLDAWAIIEGENPGDGLGFMLANCNDLNQDGYPDFAVSAAEAGKVYLVLGGSSSTSLGPIPGTGTISQVASVEIKGEPGSGFGNALACGSDLNGDGAPDLLIGAGQESSGKGAVYLFLGGSSGIIKFNSITTRNLPVQIDLTSGAQGDLKLLGAHAGENFGTALTIIGDVWNRPLSDPSQDFAVSATGIGNGTVYIFYGGKKGNLDLDQMSFPAQADADQADLILHGKTEELIGEQLAGGGDLNGDGHFDLVLSDGNGSVKVYYLVPGESSDKIKTMVFRADQAITSFLLISGFCKANETDLFLGIAGRSSAYILK